MHLRVQVVTERLSPNCRARLTVENDDRASMFSVRDLMHLATKAGIPIVFDFHHHRFCTGASLLPPGLLLYRAHCAPSVACRVLSCGAAYRAQHRACCAKSS